MADNESAALEEAGDKDNRLVQGSLRFLQKVIPKPFLS